MSQQAKFNWTNALFLTLVPVVGIVGTILLYLFSSVSYLNWVLAAAMFIGSGLALTAGYHRLFSHKTYKVAWPVRWLFIFFGSATFQGSAIEWATDHRNHHLYSDTKRDPYSVTHGFWHAHIGWLFKLNRTERDLRNVSDLLKIRSLRLQYRYFVVFASITGFLVPMGIASLWGQPLAGLIIAGALRMTISHHTTFCINSLCHTLGKREYSGKITARDNWFSALMTFGEGYHNYHHQFPLDYRNGIRFHQFDPAKWLIASLSYVGLATNLRRIPKYRIIQARVESQKMLMAEKPQSALLEPLHDSILQIIERIKSFEKAYAESKLYEYRVKLKLARVELKDSFRAWKKIMQRQSSLATGTF